jgi:hypothetical protein
MRCASSGTAAATAYNAGMSEPNSPRTPTPPAPVRANPPVPSTEKVLCERCGAEMFRMHAVWRCPSCGYKTDCCGW